MLVVDGGWWCVGGPLIGPVSLDGEVVGLVGAKSLRSGVGGLIGL